jgi:integrase-like protein
MTEISKNEHDLFKLYDKFLKRTANGIRVQKNGKRIQSSTIEGYNSLRKLLSGFGASKKFTLRIRSLNRLKAREVKAEKKYWKSFYKEFTDYMYDDCDCYDNYVGYNIKLLRSFFNYLNSECDMNIGEFHKSFYSPNEEIEIITLLPDQLKFLIHDKQFENSLSEKLKTTKELFIFGCTVALRFSDLIKLTGSNVESVSEKHYLKVSSQKTNTLTRVLLPDYAVEILKKRTISKKTIFAPISRAQFNSNVKELISLANWQDERTKTRNKRGVPIVIYKDIKKKEPYQFCDLISSHTMRRTAISTMLCLNMPENVVRKISGHAANSKEFFRYVELNQKYTDVETEKVHELMRVEGIDVN